MFNDGFVLGPQYGFKNISLSSNVAPPVVTSAIVGNSSHIQFTFNQNMLLTLLGWSFLKNGIAFIPSMVNGAGNTWNFIFVGIAAGDIITYEYDATTGNTFSTDTGVLLASTTGPQPVNNPLLAQMGYVPVGALLYNAPANDMLGQIAIPVFNGDSTDIVINMGATSGTVNASAALYELSGTDFIYIADAGNIVLNTGITQIPLALVQTLDNTKTYYLAMWADGGYDMNYDFASGGPSFESFSFVFSNGWPATISAAQRIDYTDGFSIYANYLPS